MGGEALRARLSAARRGVTSFVRADASMKRIAIEAAVEVPRAMLVIKRSSFGDACRALGVRSSTLDVPERTLTTEQRRAAKRVGAATKGIAIALGGRDTCFPQAISATRMLARRNIASFGLIGVKPGQTAALDSHAWVVAGQTIVTGSGPHTSHDPVLAFDQCSDIGSSQHEAVRR